MNNQFSYPESISFHTTTKLQYNFDFGMHFAVTWQAFLLDFKIFHQFLTICCCCRSWYLELPRWKALKNSICFCKYNNQSVKIPRQDKYFQTWSSFVIHFVCSHFFHKQPIIICEVNNSFSQLYQAFIAWSIQALLVFSI